MALQDINLDEWFAFDEGLLDDEEMREHYQEQAPDYVLLRNEAARAITSISKDNSPENVRNALDGFYKYWQNMDGEMISDERDVVNSFVLEAVKESGCGLNPHDVLGDIVYGLVGAKIRSESELELPEATLQAAVAELRAQFKAKMHATLPGLMTIKAEKNTRKTPGDDSPEYFYGFSRPEEEEEDQDTSTAQSSHAVQALSEALLKALQKETTYISIKGVGLFKMEVYPAYEGRNPRTGAVIHVPAKYSPIFKHDIELKRLIDPAR